VNQNPTPNARKAGQVACCDAQISNNVSFVSDCNAHAIAFDSTTVFATSLLVPPARVAHRHV
jgi:hypothetical protein